MHPSTVPSVMSVSVTSRHQSWHLALRVQQWFMKLLPHRSGTSAQGCVMIRSLEPSPGGRKVPVGWSSWQVFCSVISPCSVGLSRLSWCWRLLLCRVCLRFLRRRRILRWCPLNWWRRRRRRVRWWRRSGLVCRLRWGRWRRSFGGLWRIRCRGEFVATGDG